MSKPMPVHSDPGSTHNAVTSHPQKNNTRPSYVETLSLEVYLRSEPDEHLAALMRDNLSGARLCKLFPTADDLRGVFVVPDDEQPAHIRRRVAFILDEEHLAFIGNDSLAHEMLEHLSEDSIAAIDSPLACLLTLLIRTIGDDSDHLHVFEERMQQLEDAIVERPDAQLNRDILSVRRNLTALVTYYDNLADVIDELTTSPYVDDKSDRRLIKTLSRRIDRLLSVAHSLQDYSLTLREMYQSQIDLRQNNTMRILTVVTTLFMPLTLIAGWFGMNFSNMPAINHDWGYPVTIGICVVIVAAELILFARKGWFK